MKKLQSVLLLLGCLAASTAFAGDDRQGGPDGPRHKGPPPEFLSACKGMAAGARTQVKAPRGETLSGSCQLMFVPDRGPDSGPGGDDMPPPPRQQ